MSITIIDVSASIIKPSCKDCAFGVEVYSVLECHRNAPTAPVQWDGFLGGKEHYEPKTHWPKVKETDFCGEFVAG